MAYSGLFKQDVSGSHTIDPFCLPASSTGGVSEVICTDDTVQVDEVSGSVTLSGAGALWYKYSPASDLDMGGKNITNTGTLTCNTLDTSNFTIQSADIPTLSTNNLTVNYINGKQAGTITTLTCSDGTVDISTVGNVVSLSNAGSRWSTFPAIQEITTASINCEGDLIVNAGDTASATSAVGIYSTLGGAGTEVGLNLGSFLDPSDLVNRGQAIISFTDAGSYTGRIRLKSRAGGTVGSSFIDRLTISPQGVVAIPCNAVSSDVGTGALVVTGGVGIGGTLRVNDVVLQTVNGESYPPSNGGGGTVSVIGAGAPETVVPFSTSFIIPGLISTDVYPDSLGWIGNGQVDVFNTPTNHIKVFISQLVIQCQHLSGSNYVGGYMCFLAPTIALTIADLAIVQKNVKRPIILNGTPLAEGGTYIAQNIELEYIDTSPNSVYYLYFVQMDSTVFTTPANFQLQNMDYTVLYY